MDCRILERLNSQQDAWLMKEESYGKIGLRNGIEHTFRGISDYFAYHLSNKLLAFFLSFAGKYKIGLNLESAETSVFIHTTFDT